MFPDGRHEGFELENDALGRIRGWNVVDAANKDQVQGT
jgi:hypothetical protein